MKVQRTSVVFGVLALGLSAVPVFAQEAPPSGQQIVQQTVPPLTASPTAPLPTVRFQARTMEGVLVQAVTSGVQRFADQVYAVIPNLPLFSGNPHAHGYQVDPHGWVFDVEVPYIRPGTLELAVDIYRTPGARPPLPPGAQRPVSNNQTTGQAVIVAPELDPFDAPVFKDPNGEYRKSVREALIEAVLEYGGSLPLKAGEWLTVCARRPDPPFPMLMVQDDAIALIMQISGEDLALFRQKKITKEEAKAKILIKDQR